MRETFFVGRFQESRTEILVDLDGSADDRVSEFVVGHGILKKERITTENTEVTEKEKRRLRDGDFFVGAEDVAEGGADFA